MKTKLVILFAFAFLIAGTGCQKEGSSGFCETVVNANGPGYLKVINNCGTAVEVYLGNFIPVGAEIRDGACEIYGLPAKTREVEYTRLSDGKLVVRTVAIKEGETVEQVLTGSFFN